MLIGDNNHMSYQPPYRPIPPLNFHILTRVYDGFCAVFGLGKSFKKKVLAAGAVRDGETILDVGCGPGLFLILAKQKYPSSRVIGIDPDEKSLAIARRRIKYAGAGVEIHQAFAEDLPLPDGSVDVCFSILVLHHLPDEIKRRACAEMYRVLKSPGRLVIADFGKAESRLWRWLLFFEKLEYLKGNFSGLLPEYMNEAGFVDSKIAGKKFPRIDVIAAEKNPL